MEFSESPEHQMLRDAVAGLASQFGHRYYADRAGSRQPTEELWDAVAQQGFHAVHLPSEWGGGGGGISDLAIVCEELAAQGCPLLLLIVSAAISSELIARFGTDEQQATWLPQLVSGQKVVFAITEPDAGSNSHKISTVATPEGAGWRLSGSKTFISGVDEARAMLVVARTGVDDVTGKAQLSLFIVDADAPGLERQRIEMETCTPESQFQLFFDGVRVAGDRLLGKENDGLRQVFLGLNPERIMSAALCTGVGRYALEQAVKYARERQVWGVPIGSHQAVAHPLAVAKVEIELARLMLQKAAWLHDTDAHDRAAGEAANMAKYAAAEAGLHALDAAIQTHGGNGMTTEYGLADMWGFLRFLRIAPVSREMVLNYVAQRCLGLPRSY